MDKCGGSQQQDQQCNGDCGHYAAFHSAQVVGTLKGKAFFKEQCTDKNAQRKTYQTDKRVQVAAADTNHHPQRTAQEHQGAYHNEHSQHKTQGRGRTAAALKLLESQRSD